MQMKRSTVAPLLACASIIASCASAPTPVPPNASVGAMPRLWPAPEVRAPDAPPRIVAMHFSALDMARGGIWGAQFVTSTNATTLVVRSNLFAIDVPSLSPGRFTCALEIFDVPPIFLRAYRVRVIARNSRGDASEEDVPFRIR